MNIKHIGIIALIAWCVFNVYGAWNVPNWYELLVGSIVLAPFLAGLFFLSRSVIKKDMGLQKYVGIIGIAVSVFIVIFLVFQMAYVLMVYY